MGNSVNSTEKKKTDRGLRFPTNVSLILFFLKGSYRYFLTGAVSACFVALFDLIIPRMIQYTVDAVIGGNMGAMPGWAAGIIERFGGAEYLRAHLWAAALAVTAAAALGAVFRYYFRVSNAKGAETFVRRTRDQLFLHILSLPYAWQGENSTGDTIQRCTSDVETIKIFVSEQLTSLLRVFILVFMSLYFMATIQPKLTMAAAVFIPIMIISSLIFYGLIGNEFEKVDSEEGRLSAIAQENLTGVRVVRTFGREQFERERFEKQNDFFTNHWIRLMKVLAAFWVSGNVIATVRNMTVAVYGAVLCVHDELTAGGLIAFLSYNALMSLPVRGIGRVIADMSKAGVSLERLRYIMNAVPEDEEEAGEYSPAAVPGAGASSSVSKREKAGAAGMDSPAAASGAASSASKRGQGGTAGMDSPAAASGAASSASKRGQGGTAGMDSPAAASGSVSLISKRGQAGTAGAVKVPMDRDIEFSHVSFRYTDSSPWIIRNLSMKIRAGTTVGILGATGSGKTTLMLLLDRLWELPEGCGAISVGGVDIRDIDRGWLRENIGMVQQEPYLFSRTLIDNISIAMREKGSSQDGEDGSEEKRRHPASPKNGIPENGRKDFMPEREDMDRNSGEEISGDKANFMPEEEDSEWDIGEEISGDKANFMPEEEDSEWDIGEEISGDEEESLMTEEGRMFEILRASRIARLDEAVERFSDGYDTFVGERGVTLSGGQKQRAAIARMLVRRTPIMIFDDSLSAVDAETDAEIRAELRKSTGDATVILIAHRITTLQHADEIFVLEGGRVAEHGTHEQLMAQGGHYSRVYALQTGGLDESDQPADL